VTSRATNKQTPEPKQEPPSQQPANTPEPPKPGFRPKPEHNSSDDGKKPYHSPGLLSLSHHISIMPTGRTPVPCGAPTSTDHPQTATLTYRLTRVPADSTLSPPSTTYKNVRPLLDSHRSRLRLSSTGDNLSLGFITDPKNFKPIREYLRATGLGHSTSLNFDNPANNDEDRPTDPDSPEPDFGTFEP